MSHSSKDAVGGHPHRNYYNKWSKMFNRREARREARKIIRAGLADLEDEYREAEAKEFEELEWMLGVSHYEWDDWNDEEELAREDHERLSDFWEYEDPYSYYDLDGY